MNTKNTKRALISSVLALVLCFSMLIGTTFAWFTDTVTTGVNTIQSGTLEVDIVDADDVTKSLAGEKLSFRNVNGKSDILWEPGASFKLDSFKIVNKGNLALKYKIVINGVDGDAELLKVIDFTATVGSETYASLDALATALNDQPLMPSGQTGDISEEITIIGTMQTSAGNEYQDKTLDGISITVYAAQYTYESDMEDNTYDDKAVYDDEVQVPAQPWHELDAVHADTVVDGGGNTYAAEYQEICLAGNDVDITVKGVTFQNGLTVYTNGDVSGTVTLENCTIYLNNGSGNATNPSLNMHCADYGLYIGAIDKDVTYVFKNCTFTAYDSHVYTAVDKGYNVYIGGNYSADSVTFEGCTFEKSSKHGIGCSFAYTNDNPVGNTNTYYNLKVTGCNFKDWNLGDYDGAAIRGNVPADVLTEFNKTITISGNSFGNSNGSSKANVAIDSWTGSWS